METYPDMEVLKVINTCKHVWHMAKTKCWRLPFNGEYNFCCIHHLAMHVSLDWDKCCNSTTVLIVLRARPLCFLWVSAGQNAAYHIV